MFVGKKRAGNFPALRRSRSFCNSINHLCICSSFTGVFHENHSPDGVRQPFTTNCSNSSGNSGSLITYPCS
jgi:hypothetical protein